MQKFCSALIFFISLLSAFSTHSQAQQNNLFLVPITSKPNPAFRIQFAYEHDSVKIYGVNLGAIPAGLKKTKITNPKVKLNFDNVVSSAERSMESNYALQRDTSLGFRTKLTGQSYYNVLKASFLSGEGNSPIFINQYFELGGFLAPPTWPLNFSANISGIGLHTVNYLPASSSNTLPLLDTGKCERDIESMYKLRLAQGYGLDKILYKPYNARKRETVRKSFDIFFESGSTQPKAEEIKAITSYLEQNQFEIINATMKGGSSVEGDEIVNKKLQRDRARVISAALSRFNKSAIKKDTILLTDNWPEFKEQIKASQFAWLDTLPKPKLLEKINTDEKLKKSLEPILKTQRKASLNLTLAKVLTADDQFVTIKRTLNSWLKAQAALKTPNKETEQQIMGAIAYLFDQHVNEVLNSEEVDSLLEGSYQEQKYLFLGLHIIKQFTDNKFGEENKDTWRATWETLELQPWLERAQSSLITLSENASRTDLPKYNKMLIEFQAFSFRMMKLGVIDPQTICHSVYPDKPEYLSFMVYNKAYQYELVNETEIDNECVLSRTKLIDDNPTLFSPAITVDSALSNLSGLPKTGFIKRTYIKPTYDKSDKGSYYEDMKEAFLKGGRGLGSSSLDAYSLYHFIELNVINWNPEQNSFFDRDVRLEELDRLIGNLKKTGSICSIEANTLYLNYHTKTLRYLELYFEPGSVKHKDIADGALKFINSYYKAKASALPENSVLTICLYLNRFNWLPGPNEGAQYGFDLLNAIASKRKLTDAELKLYAAYLKVYDPDLEKPLPAGNPKPIVSAAMMQSY